MHPNTFTYQHVRTGAGSESAPTDTTGSLWFQLRPAKLDAKGEPGSSEVYDSLLLLSTVTGPFEIGYWRYSVAGETPAAVVFRSVTLTANTPLTVPYPYEGALTYIRSTSAIGAFTLFCQPKQASEGADDTILLGILADLDNIYIRQADGTQKSIVRHGAKGSTTAADVTGIPLGADHETLDVTALGSTAVGSVPAAYVTPLDLGSQILDADPAAGVDTQMGRLRLDSLRRLITRSYNWVSAKGASVALALTGRAVSPNVNALDVWDNAPTEAIWNYSTARGDGSAVRASDTTITFTGPTLVSGQIVRVRVTIDSTTKPLVWEHGRNAVLTISGTTITVTALDGTAAPVPNTATKVDVMWAAQDKAYDPSTQGMRNVPLVSDRSYRVTDPVAIIAAAQTVTNAWVDLGPEIVVDGATALRGWFKYTKGDGTVTTLQVRALAKHTSAGSEEYPLPVFNVNTGAVPYTITADDEIINVSPVNASGLRTLEWRFGNCVKYVQLQVIASTAGTTMTIDTAYVTTGYGG